MLKRLMKQKKYKAESQKKLLKAAIQKEIYRRFFACNSILPFTVYTHSNYIVSKHNILICQYLDRWISEQIQNLMILAPPRHGKTELVSRRLPAYLLGKFNNAKIIATSYGQTLADKNSRHTKVIIESEQYQNLFPNTKISKRKDTVEEWETTNDGEYLCSGIGGGITGSGFRWGLIDDPIKDRKQAESRTYRDNIWEWFTSTFFTRMDLDGGQILLIQTLWHKDDLAGRLLDMQKSGEGIKWTVLSLPAIAEKDDIFRNEGEALFPEKFPLKRLFEIKATIGNYDWSSLYQGKPVPPEGQKIHSEWFNVIDKVPDGLNWVRFYDLAVSTKTTADNTASFAMAEKDGNIYLRDLIMGQWEWPQTRKIMHTNCQIDGPDCIVGIEQAGQQEGFIQDVKKDELFEKYIIKGITSDTDKLTRALPWIARAEAGKVYLINGRWITKKYVCAGNRTFFDICDDFTGHDDTCDDPIDAISGCYKMLFKSKPRVAIV